jgi:methionyl aminopeptidase
MEKSCRLAAETLEYAKKNIKAGMTTNDVDQLVHDYILTNDAVPSPLNYHGFPKSICTSVNDVICHGVPDETLLKDGDIVNVDVTVYKYGFHGDTSATLFIGDVSARAKAVTDCAFNAMHKGIDAIEPNGYTGDIGFAVNKFVTGKGYYTVKEIGGHGIGREFHEDPFVPSFGKRGRGARLKPWGTITVEPMVNESDEPFKECSIANSSIKYYKTGDGTLSAQFEHTVLITDVGVEILTSLD